MTTAIDLDPVPFDQVVQEINIIVAERPEDYVYQRPANGSCAYVHVDRGHSEAGCIVGVWLHRFQLVPLDVLHLKEGAGADMLAARLYHMKAIPRPLDRRAARFLDQLQTKADGGWTWRRAADFAALHVRNEWDSIGDGSRLMNEGDW